jgi:hypothetical protein
LCATGIHPRRPIIPDTQAITDMGATSAMVMSGTPMKNVRLTIDPLNINLPDGKMVKSTHICDIEIPGLPHVLKGHIIPALNVTSLIGIRVLCKAGCRVIFTDTACYVKYNKKIVLVG